jgi:methylthioribose-1-phosphate isomerase
VAVTVAALTPESIVRLEDATLVMLDQRRLPGERVELRFDRWQDVIDAIRTMAVRGAPAIGIAAAYAVAMAALRSPAGSLEGMREDVERACVGLAGARPTAVNLAWAVDRMRETAAAPHAGPEELREALVERANAIHTDEVECCRRIGEHGAELLRAGAQVLTHCNAGALATGGYGTALGVIRSAHRRDPRLHVWVDETRPLLQGARLTAWELEQDGIPGTLLTDSSAAWLMAQGKVDAVITGADRIARNGDVANKIGTYGLAVAARAHAVPFYVAAPTSPIDPGAASGAEIPLEHRAPAEVAGAAAPDGYGVYNPAFDVTPADLISAIVTEDGVHRPPYRFG